MNTALNTPVVKMPRAFGWKDIAGYFFGDFGCNMSFSLISSYMFLFFTQYIGIRLEHYALIILISKIWDGINDPIIGAMVDRFTPKSGDKFRPWIFWGAWPLAIAGAVMFLDTAAWPYWGKLTLMIVGYFVWDIAYTVVNVPYGSMNSVITADPVQRSQLSTFRSFGAIIAGVPLGILIPFFAYKQQAVDGAQKSIFQGQAMLPIALVLGLVALASFMILWAWSVERIQHSETGSQKFNYFKTIKSFFTSRPILGFVLGQVSYIIFIMSSGQLNQMTFQLYFGNGQLNSLVILTYLIPMVGGAFLVKPLVKRFGKKNLVAWPTLGSVVVYALMWLLPISSPYVWIGLMVLAATCSVGQMLVGWAMVSDLIDYSEYRTGQREEGSIYATYSMVRKLGQGIGQAMVPAFIALLIPGLVMNDASTWSMDYATSIKNMTAIFPLIGSVITFLAYQFIYNLDTQKLAEIERALGRTSQEVDTSIEAITRKED